MKTTPTRIGFKTTRQEVQEGYPPLLKQRIHQDANSFTLLPSGKSAYTAASRFRVKRNLGAKWTWLKYELLFYY